jgi:phosphoenolpyruvate carboxylase
MPRQPRTAQATSAEKNRSLVEDIRLLGRILGDVIREQEGAAAFELIERIRQLAVAYRLKRDASAGKTLDRLLKNLSVPQAVSVVRAFSYFSHLANLAEDREQLRRLERHERAATVQEGTLAMSFERLAQRGVRASEIAEMLTHAYLSPVLTAHPTEVQRKSILDAERAVAQLIQARDDVSTERARSQNEAALRARVTQLWQTRLLRTSKLSVANEIDNALSYYQSTFLREIPRLYAEIEQHLNGFEVASFFRCLLYTTPSPRDH